jgi:hypothetical protein
MVEKTIDELARENAILINKKPDVFYEEKGHLKSSLQYMIEENGTWKFKGNIPMATAMKVKNILSRDNAKMSKAITRMDVPKDKNRKIVIAGVAIASVLGFYILYRYNKKKKEERISMGNSPPNVFDAVIPKKPKKVIKKMIIEEFEKNEEDNSNEGSESTEDS